MGAKIKHRSHLGHTVPRVGKTISTQAGMSSGTKNFGSQTAVINKPVMQTSGSQTRGPARADAGVQFKADVRHAGIQVGNEGPRFPKMQERPAYNPNGVRGYPVISGMGPRPQYNENPGRVEQMLDAPDRMQGVKKEKKKGSGPKKMEIDRKGRVKKEVARIDAVGDDSNELVGAEEILRKAPPRQAPKPAAPKPAAAPKAAPQKEAPKPRKKAPPAQFTPEQEAVREQAKIDQTVRENKASRSAKIDAMREHIKKSREGKVGPERAGVERKEKVKAKKEEIRADKGSSFARAKAKSKEEKGKGKMHHPSASANIPDAAGPSGEHHHHHTGHRHMHDDDFRTGL